MATKKRNRNNEHISYFINRENNKKNCQSTEIDFRKETKLIFVELYQEEIMYLKKSKLYTTSLFESAFLKKSDLRFFRRFDVDGNSKPSQHVPSKLKFIFSTRLEKFYFILILVHLH
jgi:hypothetical protein